MAEAIQDPIQGPIAAVDRQDGRFSFGEIHEYVVRTSTLKDLPRKQAGSQEEAQVLFILL